MAEWGVTFGEGPSSSPNRRDPSLFSENFFEILERRITGVTSCDGSGLPNSASAWGVGGLATKCRASDSLQCRSII